MSNAFDDENWIDNLPTEPTLFFYDDLTCLRDAYSAARNVVLNNLDKVSRDQAEIDRDYQIWKSNNQDFDEDDDFENSEAVQELTNLNDGMIRVDAERQNFLSILPPIIEAFTIALFHFWEKKVSQFGGPNVMKNRNYDHDSAMGFLARSGWKPDAKKLRALELTAHVAKHSSGRSAAKLIINEPSLFTEAAQKSHDLTGHETLLLTHDVLFSFFVAVEQSGPR